MTTKKEALSELTTARDEARVRFHLLSLEARERWQELEKALDALEQKLEHGGDKTSEAISGKIRALTRTVKHFIATHSGMADLNAPVRAIMNQSVRTCSPTDTINRVAQVLWEANCGAAPIVDDEGVLVGMVTDRDACMACYTQGTAPSDASVERVMSKQVYACSPDDSIQRLLEIMREKQVRRVPVTTSEGHLVGIVALADVATWVQTLSLGRPAACEALAATLAAISRPPGEPAEPAAAAAE